MRWANVTIEAVNAWEVWSIRVPDDLEDGDIESWVRENFDSSSEKEIEESGADSYQITEIEVH